MHQVRVLSSMLSLRRKGAWHWIGVRRTPRPHAHTSCLPYATALTIGAMLQVTCQCTHLTCSHMRARRHTVGSSSAPLSAATRDRLFATELHPLHPYGVDPVFLPSSALYDSHLSDSTVQYYNTTAGSGEVSATGAPYAFYHRPLQVCASWLCCLEICFVRL